ncbi:3239_t:CDS:2, partial [Gigaspora margarita]
YISESNKTNPDNFENSINFKDTRGLNSSKAKCLYCSTKWARGKPEKLEAHFVL